VSESVPTASPKLPRSVVALGWVSFFADVSGEMIYPLLPLFVVGVLGASATSLGWVEGTAQAVVALLTAWAGWRSDRIRRRLPYVHWGYGLPVIGKALLAAAVAWPWVLAGRAVDRLGKGLRSSPRDALIADVTDKSILGRAFGFHRALDTAGALVGALLAAVLLWWLVGTPMATDSTATREGSALAFRIVFAIAAALGVASLGLTFLVREPERGSAPARKQSSEDEQSTGVLGLPRRYWTTVAILLMFAVANSSDTFLLLRAADFGAAPWVVVLMYALYNSIYALCSYPAGILSDRFGRWRVIGVGWGIYAAVYCGFAYTGSAGLWPLFAAYGLFVAFTDGVGKALVVEHAPAAKRGLAIGLFYLALGLTTLVSSVVAGELWDRVGHGAPFLFGAGAAVLALLALLAARWPRRASP